jgi:hypothetical protein
MSNSTFALLIIGGVAGGYYLYRASKEAGGPFAERVDTALKRPAAPSPSRESLLGGRELGSWLGPLHHVPGAIHHTGYDYGCGPY